MLRKKVIVDTNALLIPGEFGVDIFEELERLGYEHIIVPEAVLSELDRLRQRPDLKGKEKRAAKIGYSLVLKYVHEEHDGCMVTINKEEDEEESEGRKRDVDELIAKMALKLKAAVLTSDEPLRRKLSEAGVATVYLRGKSRLEEK